MSSGCILLAGITGKRESACLNFVMTCIRLQTHLQRTPGTEVHISFFKHVNDALSQFYKEAQLTHLVVIDTDKGCEPDFVLAALDDGPEELVAGAYPLSVIDWERVERQIDNTSESAHAKGNVYNFNAQTATSVMHDSALTTVAELGVFRVSKAALLAFLGRQQGSSTLQAEDGSIVAFKETIIDGTALLPSETFCKLWGLPIKIDLRFPCTNTSPYPFAGAVGHRKDKIR